MKTFAQLKKDLQVGVKVKTLTNKVKPQYENEIRTIEKVQTNAIAFNCKRPKYVNGEYTKETFDTLSWLWWQKANNYEYEGNIFNVYDFNEETKEKELVFSYEILK